MDIRSISTLASEYNDAGLGKTWAGAFLKSISESEELPRGRGVSILDEILKKGSPSSWPHWDVYQTCIEYAEKMEETSENAKTLRSIASYFASGKELSEKQVSLVKKIVDSHLKPSVKKNLDEDDKKFIEIVRRVVTTKSHYYWQNYRPGVYSKVSKIFNELNLRNALLGFSEIKIDANEIEQESWDFLTDSFKINYSTWTSSLDLYGKVCKIKETGELCMVIGNRAPGIDGKVVVDIMVNSSIKKEFVSALSEVKERKKREKKSIVKIES
jgi:hypothetical protein